MNYELSACGLYCKRQAFPKHQEKPDFENKTLKLNNMRHLFKGSYYFLHTFFYNLSWSFLIAVNYKLVVYTVRDKKIWFHMIWPKIQ